MIEITKIIFLIVMASVLTSGYSNAAINETQDIDNLNLPDYGPHIFEEIENEPRFINARGTMPTITDNKEKLEWTDKLGECSVDITENNTELMSYFYVSGGPLLSFGVSINGYLEVGCNSATPEKVNSTVIDEIYSIIDTQCEKKGINDVPVVFIWTEMGTEDSPGFTSTMLILCVLILIIIKRQF